MKYSDALVAGLLSIASCSVALAEATTPSPSIAANIHVDSWNLLAPYKVVAPMGVSAGYMSTKVSNQGSSSTMIFMKKGKFVLDFQVNAPDAAHNSLSFALVPYVANAKVPSSMKTLEFIPASSATLQRVAGVVEVVADGWYMLYLQGAEAGTGVSKLRVIAAADTAVTVAATEPTLVPSAKAVAAKLNDKISFGGMPWTVQTAGITIDDKTAFFKASTGEFAYFDPADGRKIRSEMASGVPLKAMAKLTAEFDLAILAPTVPHTDLQWFTPVQIHQADTRDAQGINLASSPMFSFDLQPNKALNGYDLMVRGETSTNMAGGFAPLRVLGSTPFKADGSLHHVKMEVVDSHGRSGGMIHVIVDGVTVADLENVPVGYAYVETPILYGGKPQSADSYLKVGIYSGNQFRPADVSLETIISNFSYTVK